MTTHDIDRQLQRALRRARRRIVIGAVLLVVGTILVLLSL